MTLYGFSLSAIHQEVVLCKNHCNYLVLGKNSLSVGLNSFTEHVA